MLRPDELRAMRGTMTACLPDQCDILSNQGVANGMGQQADAWQTIQTGVPCRLVPLLGKDETDLGDKTTATAEAAIIVPYGTDVRASQRLRVSASGATYEVKYRHPAESEDLSLMVTGQLVE